MEDMSMSLCGIPGSFMECEHLKNARLPEGVKIGTNAFYGCTAWAAAPENKAELENSLQINGISINQYKSWCSLDYRVYLLADIISQIPDCYRLSMGTEFAIVSDQGDCDRMYVARGLDDNLETVNYNMRLWTEIPCGRNGMEIHWTCFCEDEIVTEGNVTGPLELGERHHKVVLYQKGRMEDCDTSIKAWKYPSCGTVDGQNCKGDIRQGWKSRDSGSLEEVMTESYARLIEAAKIRYTLIFAASLVSHFLLQIHSLSSSRQPSRLL